MLGLYFGNITQVISTVLIICIILYIIYILTKLKENNHWGITFTILFCTGLFMSIISGTRDMIGTPNGFPAEGLLFVILCALGILGFIIGLVALISKLAKTKIIYQYGSYFLMAIIIIKTFLVETRRILLLLS